MNKTTQSILLAAMLAASGFAAAQNPAVPATRAEVKSEAKTGERLLGTGEPAKSAPGTPIQGTTAGTAPAATRAEVKSDAGMTERKAGTGEPIKPNMSEKTKGNTSGTTRAEVKTEAGTEPRKLGTGEVAKSSTPSASSAERKRMRDERRAMNKANRDAKMKSGSTMTPAPVSEKAP
jgi:hypothetical protein